MDAGTEKTPPIADDGGIARDGRGAAGGLPPVVDEPE